MRIGKLDSSAYIKCSAARPSNKYALKPFSTGPLYSSDLRIVLYGTADHRLHTIMTVLYTLIDENFDNYTYEYIV